MEENVQQVCPSCGKENPPNARYCFTCGSALSADAISEAPDGAMDSTGVPGVGAHSLGASAPAPNEARPETQPQHLPPAPAPAAQHSASGEYPTSHSAGAHAPSQPRRRGRLRCCAIGCLVVLIVLLIGLPILHLTVIRPFIESEIYKQVRRSLNNVGQGSNYYYGTDLESVTELQLNQDAQEAWDYIPGSSDGHIYLRQDQLKLELKIYGVKVWATTDLRVDSNGNFVVKSIKMNWLLNLIFSESALKREIASFANDKLVQARGLYILAFQVTDGNLFIAYKPR